MAPRKIIHSYAELEDAITFLRMTLPVSELKHLSATGRDTPVSGDALMAYGGKRQDS